MKKLRIGFVLLGLSSAAFVGGCGNISTAPPGANPGSHVSSPNLMQDPVSNVTVAISRRTATGARDLSPATYGSGPLVVSPGTSVTWVNSDSVEHSATADSGAFDSGALAPNGGTYSYTFTKPGKYPYHSTVAGDRMSSIIEVSSGPTGGDGNPDPTTTVNPADPSNPPYPGGGGMGNQPRPLPTYPVDCPQCQQQQKPVPKPTPKPKPKPTPRPKPTKPMPGPLPTLY